MINSTLLGTNLATMGAFVTMGPASPLIAATCLGANTILSFLKGYTTTAAIGGADMRMSSLPHTGRIANTVKLLLSLFSMHTRDSLWLQKALCSTIHYSRALDR